MTSDQGKPSSNECIPLAARREINELGQITDQRVEPGGADLRKNRDGQKDALLKIISGILGVGLDDLKRRDYQARQKRLLRTCVASIAFALFAILLATFAFFQRSEARKSSLLAIEKQHLAENELVKTQTITNFVQNLFFSLDPKNTAGMDTALLKSMLEQGSIKANQLEDKPEIEAKIRLCLAQSYRSIRSYDLALKELERTEVILGDIPQISEEIKMKARYEHALVHEALGNYLEAEPMLVYQLNQLIDTLGPNHPDTIEASLNLSKLYRRVGRLEEAQKFCTESLNQLNDLNTPSDAPVLLDCMTEMAKVYLALDKTAQAESLMHTVYQQSRISLGDNHPLSFQRGQVLANALRMSNKLDEAESLGVEIVTGLQDMLGTSHPDTLGAMDLLADIVIARKDYARAEELYGKILSIKEQKLGEMHPETIHTLRSVVGIHVLTENLIDASNKQFTAYNRLKEKYGHEHPETLRAMSDLADIYLKLDNLEESFSLSEQTYEIQLRILSDKDPMTLRSLSRIGHLHFLMERKDESLEILAEALRKQEKVLGYDNIDATKTRDLLNQILAEKTTTAVHQISESSSQETEDYESAEVEDFLREAVSPVRADSRNEESVESNFSTQLSSSLEREIIDLDEKLIAAEPEESNRTQLSTSP